MKRGALVLVAAVLCASVALTGCGAPKEASGQAAIQKSQTMATVQQKTDYLIGQAKAFMNSKDYDQAITIVQHVLNRVNSDSQEARALLEKARAEVTGQAGKAVEDVKKAFANFGK